MAEEARPSLTVDPANRSGNMCDHPFYMGSLQCLANQLSPDLCTRTALLTFDHSPASRPTAAASMILTASVEMSRFPFSTRLVREPASDRTQLSQPGTLA